MKRNHQEHAGSTGQAAFTLVELLVVISIIAVLAGLTAGLAGRASSAGKVSRTQSELAQIQTAIDSYHSQFNYYPPDNRTNAALSPLFYELGGVISQDGINFQAKNSSEKISQSVIQRLFGVEGIVNPGKEIREVKTFGTFKAAQSAEINTGPSVRVLVAPVPWPLGDPLPPVPGRPGVNPWRYVSTNPTNNPTRYDLWAEILVGKERRIIRNW